MAAVSPGGCDRWPRRHWVPRGPMKCAGGARGNSFHSKRPTCSVRVSFALPYRFSSFFFFPEGSEGRCFLHALRRLAVHWKIVKANRIPILAALWVSDAHEHHVLRALFSNNKKNAAFPRRLFYCVFAVSSRPDRVGFHSSHAVLEKWRATLARHAPKYRNILFLLCLSALLRFYFSYCCSFPWRKRRGSRPETFA